MKTIHHIIVAAVDSGIPELEAENLARALLGENEPIASLASRIANADEEIQRLTNYRKALISIRDKWAGTGSFAYANIEDRESAEADRLRG